MRMLIDERIMNIEDEILKNQNYIDKMKEFCNMIEVLKRDLEEDKIKLLIELLDIQEEMAIIISDKMYRAGLKDGMYLKNII